MILTRLLIYFHKREHVLNLVLFRDTTIYTTFVEALSFLFHTFTFVSFSITVYLDTT